MKKQAADTYNRLFSEHFKTNASDHNLVIPHIEPHNTSAWAQYTIQVNDREAVQERLKHAGIPTAVHYPIPLNKQPAVANDSAQLTVGDKVAEQVMSLPMSPGLAHTDQARIAELLRA